MGNQIKRTVGTPICFAAFSDTFSPTTANDLRQGWTSTGQVDIALALTPDEGARQSDKCDLGEQRAPAYAVKAVFDFGNPPTSGEYVECYWGPSTVGTAGNGNVAGLTGASGEYTPYGSDANFAYAAQQMDFVGNFVIALSSGVQVGSVGTFSPSSRYGSLVVRNKSEVTLGDNVETHVLFEPILDEVE
jgi:hypothetical protein